MPTTFIGNLPAAALAFEIANCIKQTNGPVLVMANSMQQAQLLAQQCPVFLDKETSCQHFPDWEILPYDRFSPHQDIISERLTCLYHLPRQQNGVVIAAVQSLMQPLPPQAFIDGQTFLYGCGDQFIIDQERRRLEQVGYQCVQQVLTRGEFAVRGSLMDIFPMGAKQPFRIDLFDDEIETIRFFDPETQRSEGETDHIALLPAHEYPFTESACEHFVERWQETFPENTWNTPIINSIAKQQNVAGIESYLPLFFEQTATLFNYLPDNAHVIHLDGMVDSATTFWQSVEQRYQFYRHDREHPCLPPAQVFTPPDTLLHHSKAFQQIKLQPDALRKTGPTKHNRPYADLPELAINSKAADPYKHLTHFLKDTSKRVLFAAESLGRREALHKHLVTMQLPAQTLETWHDWLKSDVQYGLIAGDFPDSFVREDLPWVLIHENQLYPHRIPQQRRKTSTLQNDQQQIAIRDLTELHEGAAVVHIEHGVGRYMGLTTLSLNGQENEYLTLHYAKDDKLYVPIHSLHLISQYSGTDLEHAPLSRLGSDQWDKAKEKAAKRIRDVAAELLDIYARREAKVGLEYRCPKTDYAQFCEGFPFEETPDQQAAIDAVLEDMRKAQPMDRLLCGDVGFGKTEVAMRAAFVAVQNGKQVAILVPTTLLAQQHHENFQDRFANWAVNVELLSRFRTAKQQKETLAQMATGQIDIVIGTHALLGKQVKFKDLGLLIIDEEHRFGVRHKDQIKSLRSEVDILAMTATPIPRTLNLSLSHIRDLSIIATPPAKRRAVQLFVREHNKDLITEAISREIARGGQVYYLHNSVETIQQTAEKLQEWLPNVNFIVGHGQMRERELEKVMADFYHNRFQVLVCTTIIETGIDLPNANTMIIDRADKFGLAQLHQLRGRVGRSHHQAYAYLLTPPWSALSSDAQKRLTAIQEADQLGAGFMLASHDLEIRGAGELLGEEQSGNMQTIGFGLYMELLDKTVAAMKSGKTLDLNKDLRPQGCEIDLGISTIIPETYLGDVPMRLQFYKRIANCNTQEALDALQVEMIDRFGLLPETTKHLFAITELRLQADALSIIAIKGHKAGGTVTFVDTPPIDPMAIIKLIQLYPKQYKLNGQNKVQWFAEQEDPAQRLTQVDTLLKKLQAKKD